MEKVQPEILRMTKCMAAGAYDRDADILLISCGNRFRLPQKVVDETALCFEDERWMPNHVANLMKEEAGTSTMIKDGKTITIKEGVDPLAPTYSVYFEGLRTEYSVVIVGEIEPRRIIEGKASFYAIDEIIEMITDGAIKGLQARMIMAIMASQDWPNRYYNQIAREELPKMYKK